MSKIKSIIAAAALICAEANADITEEDFKIIRSNIYHEITKAWRIPVVTYTRKTTTSVVSFDKHGNIINIYLLNPATSEDAETFHRSIKFAIKRASPFDEFKKFEITESDVEKHFTNMEIKFTTPADMLNGEWKKGQYVEQ